MSSKTLPTTITKVTTEEEINSVCYEEEIGGRLAHCWSCRFPGCTATFTDRTCMVAHEQVHVGRRIFACAHVNCGYKALLEEAIIEHVQAKHLNSGQPWKRRKFNKDADKMN